MKLVKAYNSVSLVLRIVIGMVIGAALALLIPNAAVTAPGIGILGTLFVGALKAIAPLLVFVLIISALAQSKEKLGKQFGTVIVLYLVSTFLAAVIAVIASYLFPVTITLTEAASDSAPESFAAIFTGLLNNIVSNPIGSIVSANYLGVLFWAIVLGFAFKGASDTTKKFLADASEAVTKAVRFVINLAPFGILGLVFSAVSTSGLAIFTEYGKLLLILVGCMLFAALVVNPIMTFIVIRKNPYPLVFKCLKESGVTAFFTRSSAANIPVNMSLCESLGLDKEFYSVSIPLGATINMAGAAVTITVMTLAAVHTLGITVQLPVAIILSVMAALGACGASGVAGGSLLLIPMACSLFGISNDVAMQVVGVGFIIGVIQDSVETAVAQGRQGDQVLSPPSQKVKARPDSRPGFLRLRRACILRSGSLYWRKYPAERRPRHAHRAHHPAHRRHRGHLRARSRFYPAGAADAKAQLRPPERGVPDRRRSLWGHVPVFNEHGRPRAGLQPVGRHGLSRVRADGRQPDPGVDQLPHLV